jgi:hypothetical protein
VDITEPSHVLDDNSAQSQISWTPYDGPGAVDSTMMVGITVITIGGTLVVAYNTIYTRRDRFLIHGVIFGAALLTHTGNIWTLACCHLDLDPLWPAKALPYDHGFLAFLWATGFSLIGA